MKACTCGECGGEPHYIVPCVGCGARVALTVSQKRQGMKPVCGDCAHYYEERPDWHSLRDFLRQLSDVLKEANKIDRQWLESNQTPAEAEA